MATTNLPVQLTSFIGRENELAEVSRLVGLSRLVTLTGAGGCGKTRLALHTASQISDTFKDGVWLVDLVTLREPSLVPQFVLQALGVHEMPNQSHIESLQRFVQAKQMLLILDNCEHLSDACGVLARAILVQAPQLRILATSREPLGVTGETGYYVPPLSLPPDSHSPVGKEIGTEDCVKYDSIRLFVDRAQAVVPDFTVTSDNAAVVIDICRRLDGIPLAIELATARIRILSLEQISARLADRFSLLVSGQRIGQVPHHHTLHATLDWSYALLTPPEQMLLRRLAVFVAGFSLDMVESICCGEDIDRSEILTLLSSLVDKSLVVAETLTGPEARYRLLSTIRDYALEKLDEAGKTEVLRDCHLDVFVARAEETAPKLVGAYQQIWFNWLEGEHDDLRAALAWALERQRIEDGLRIATAIYQFWEIRNYRQEGLGWFERLLAQADDRVSLAVHSSACTYAAFLTEFVGDAPAALKFGRRGVELGEAAGDEGKPILGFALAGLAAAMKAVGDYQALFNLGERYIQLFRRLGDAYAYYLGMGLLVQGQTAISLGKYDIAHFLLDESIALARQAGDPFRVAHSQNLLGDLARCEQRYSQAATFYEESIALLQEIGADRDVAASLHNLGHTCMHLGDIERAQALFAQSMTIQQAQQNTAGMAECLIGFAALTVARGSPATAARLLAVLTATGWEQKAWEWPATRAEYEQTLAHAHAQLTDEEFEAEQATGRALVLEQAVAYALNLPFLTLDSSQERAEPTRVLTVREREIVTLITQGRSNGEIADELVLSKRTVEKHIANILSKLDFSNRTQIVLWAIENGMTHPPS